LFGRKAPKNMGVVYMQKLSQTREKRVHELAQLRSSGKTLIFLSILTLAIVAGFLLAVVPALR
jgi:hypothetical protein